MSCFVLFRQVSEGMKGSDLSVSVYRRFTGTGPGWAQTGHSCKMVAVNTADTPGTHQNYHRTHKRNQTTVSHLTGHAGFTSRVTYSPRAAAAGGGKRSSCPVGS